MKIARTKNAMKGIATGLILRIYQMIIPFLMRTAMIHFMGIEYLGLNSLFSSVLHVLNLAELGVGAAMVFSMYKPIAEDDTEGICALLKLYRTYYRVIGLVIGVVGLLLTPVVPHLISGEIPSELNIYILYWLNLGATVLTYWLFAYRGSILQACQRVDLVNAVILVTSTVQYALQLAVMVWFRDYYLYVIVLLATTLLNNILTAVMAAKVFPQYKPEGDLPKERTRQINQKIRDLFTGKLGSVVLSSSDTIVISAFLGLTMLAVYQNYYFILSAVIAIVEILMSSIRAGLGNSFVVETKEKNYQEMQTFTFLYVWVIAIGSCCFLGMYQPFMEIWMGTEQMLGWAEVICFALFFYVFSLNKLLNVYKDAAGLWHEDRFRPLITAAVNLTLNLLWIRKAGICGVVLSTVASQLFVGIPWLLHNLFRLFFGRERLKGYCVNLLKYAALALCAGVVVYFICVGLQGSPWARLGIAFAVAVSVPFAIFGICFSKTPQFSNGIRFLDRITGKRLGLERKLIRHQGK